MHKIEAGLIQRLQHATRAKTQDVLMKVSDRLKLSMEEPVVQAMLARVAAQLASCNESSASSSSALWAADGAAIQESGRHLETQLAEVSERPQISFYQGPKGVPTASHTSIPNLRIHSDLWVQNAGHFADCDHCGSQVHISCGGRTPGCIFGTKN